MRTKSRIPTPEQAKRRKAKRAEYLEENRHLINARARARYASNPEKERIRKALFAIQHPEKIREYRARSWYKKRCREDHFFHMLGHLSALGNAMKAVENENNGRPKTSGAPFTQRSISASKRKL